MPSTAGNDNDNARRQIVGTTRYTLDEAGHFATGEVYLRMQSFALSPFTNTMTPAGIRQEIQSDKSDNVLHKIVYTYDSLGKPTGYAIYDGAGRLISQTNPLRAASATATKKKKSR